MVEALYARGVSAGGSHLFPFHLAGKGAAGVDRTLDLTLSSGRKATGRESPCFAGGRRTGIDITALTRSPSDLTIRDTYRILAYDRQFRRSATERFFRDGVCPAQWRSFEAVAARKLDMVDAATGIDDLRSPPGNRLEALRGDRGGQWSIRVNRQWRICFRWTPEGPADVEIVDYH